MKGHVSDLAWYEDGKQPSEFSLLFVTNPDDVHILFVPGVGITRYEYQHHGTRSRVDAELIEYRPSTRPK